MMTAHACKGAVVFNSHFFPRQMVKFYLAATITSMQQSARPLKQIPELDGSKWIDVAQLLAEVERERSWNDYGYDYFSNFLQDLSRHIFIHESGLWRYLSSYKYMLSLKALCEAQNQPSFDLHKVGSSISPENIELLEKISRVATEHEVNELFSKLISNSISRASLRRIWNAYRPALQGRTARSKSLEKPKARLEDTRQVAINFELRVFDLLNEDRSFTSSEWLTSFRIFQTVISGEQPPLYKFDYVVAAKGKKDNAISLHGFEVVHHPKAFDFFRRPRAQKPFVHFLWIALERSKFSESMLHRFSDELGLIVFDHDSYQIYKKAERLSAEHCVDTALSLLAYSTRC
jgi:hypothetical protein